MDTLVAHNQRAAEARDMLAHIFARHDRVFLAFSGGKESLALARLCDPWAGRFRLLWANTGYAFPHVEALIRSYGERYGLDERRSDLIANWKANGLPSNVVPIPNALGGGLHAEPKLQAWPACCGALRSAPMLDMLQAETAPVAVIHGQRHEDRTPGLGMSGWPVPECVEVVAPLADWSRADVLAFLEHEGVDLPAHYADVPDSLDCWLCPSAFGEAKGPARAAYMRKAYPEMLEVVMPGVRRTREAVAAVVGTIGMSVESAQPPRDELRPVAQHPDRLGDCVIAALATILGRTYPETATLLGFPCDPATGHPVGLHKAGVPITMLAAPLLAAGIPSTIIVSDEFAARVGDVPGVGLARDRLHQMLRGRRAVVMIEERHDDGFEMHALGWVGDRLYDCRPPAPNERPIDGVEILAAVVM
ncbi:hypothetical protein D3218_01745 [Aureimonas flava]|uniref:Phosphoadenosine phosphosulphate reductase domain-containing protein n=1 Tax=Aureimonas flava TaxID=2320271 RepID=A0A3A1WNN5_9HYPH|nr:phosphoadenosine phosphosulfate reductase family protein [Aureimonas flava]RIY03507.1 hypothetical protein D3218_01745 [Aureimonas flava]